jgi:hypothetical protein
VAALNHSNVCHLYDVGPNYLVLEYVDGETPRGPLSFDEALPTIRQLIDGLEAAYDGMGGRRPLGIGGPSRETSVPRATSMAHQTGTDPAKWKTIPPRMVAMRPAFPRIR